MNFKLIKNITLYFNQIKLIIFYNITKTTCSLNLIYSLKNITNNIYIINSKLLNFHYKIEYNSYIYHNNERMY